MTPSEEPLYAESHGTGPAVVMLHGWGMHSGIWEDAAEALVDDYRVTLVDLPGHGRSVRTKVWRNFDELVERVAAAVGVPAAWIGWSLGGLVALGVALKYPERVHRLILICSNPCFRQRDDWHCAMVPDQLRQFAIDLAQDYRSTLKRFLALEVHGVDHAAQQMRTLRRIVFEHGDPEPAALRAGLEALNHVDLRARLPEIRCPVRLIMGRRDNLVPAAAGAATAALLPDARVRVLDGAGHAPFLGDAALFSRTLKEFLDD